MASHSRREVTLDNGEGKIRIHKAESSIEVYGERYGHATFLGSAFKQTIGTIKWFLTLPDAVVDWSEQWSGELYEILGSPKVEVTVQSNPITKTLSVSVNTTWESGSFQADNIRGTTEEWEAAVCTAYGKNWRENEGIAKQEQQHVLRVRSRCS
jgi:hypothetical protein